MIEVFANKKPAGNLSYSQESREFIFNYTHDNPISLTMPYSTKSYLSYNKLHPIFDMVMPEGYLFELLKNLLIKEYGTINDFILFSHLSKHIEGYLTYASHPQVLQQEATFTLDQLISSHEEDLFARLVERFLSRSAIAGVQPKVVVPIYDKATLSTKEYIVKTFSDEFPHLAENEFFCMRAMQHAEIATPRFWLSDDKKRFIMEKFTYRKSTDNFYGFEEFCVLFGYNKEQKYRGSYEQIAKAVAQISTQAKRDLETFFAMIVMNYLLKNGDAHLKNFGMLYTPDKRRRYLAPAYDVISTLPYLPKDKPALTLNGKKIWVGKRRLVAFGTTQCLLDEKTAKETIKRAVSAVEQTIEELEAYMRTNPDFEAFGTKLIRLWRYSIETFDQDIKDASDALL